MTNGNDNGGNGPSRPNDWAESPQSNDPPDGQEPPRADQPQPVPPHEPEAAQPPGAQGARQPQGGESSAGYAVPLERGGMEDAHGDQLPGDQPPAVRPGAKPKPDSNDILAVILSIFFPGVGQMMLGQTTKGVVVLLVTVFTCAVGGLLSIAAALDTYCVAMAKKKRPVDDWEFFPDINDIF